MKRRWIAVVVAASVAAFGALAIVLLASAPGCSASSGSPSMPPTPPTPPAPSNSVLERNNHPSRDAHFIQPALTKAAAATMTFEAGFQANFPGAMFASPLYLENGPGGKGVFFAVTNLNDVFALDETTGAVVWKHNIGASPTASGAGCGNITPIGILSTPVIDPAARTIYVAGAIGSGAMIERHEVHALSVDDGTERAGWPVDVSKLTAPSADGGAPLPFMPSPENQRSALSLVKGILYVAYGGHVGDCGPYHGWVVAINTAKPTELGGWATGSQGEGIWAAGGMASDGDGVFAATGNNTAHVVTHFDSEEIVRITGMGTLDRSTGANYFYPTNWLVMDVNDADFASSNPMYVPVPGATPAAYVVAFSKDGHMYMLDSTNLGSVGGQLVDLIVATAESSIHTSPTAYVSNQRVHVALSIDATPVCPPATANGRVVMSVIIPPGTPPQPHVVWCVFLGGVGTVAPISTTTDGKNDAMVWFMNGNVLNGVDGDTGATIYGGGPVGAGSCPGVRQWTQAIAVKGRIIVGGDVNGVGHLCSWAVHPAPSADAAATGDAATGDARPGDAATGG
jgi:hypothetical protein